MPINPTHTYAQQLFAVTRVVGGKEINLTVINGELYLTGKQIREMLELDNRGLRYHIYNTIKLNPNHHEYKIYSAPVLYARGPLDVGKPGGGGGTKLTYFYTPGLALAVAMRMKNTMNKAQIIMWLTELVNERVNTGN